MERSCFSEKTLTLSVLTAEFARCVLQTGAPVTARSFLLRGLPMTLALVLITALTAGGRAACRQFLGYRLAFPGSLRRAGTLVCLGGCGDLPSGAGALLGKFFFHGHAGASPAAALGRMEAGTFGTGPLCADPVLGGGAGGFALPAGAEWPVPLGKVDAAHRCSVTLTLPLYPEYFALPLFCPAKQVRCAVWLPVKAFILAGSFALCTELVFGAGNALPGIELFAGGQAGQHLPV